MSNFNDIFGKAFEFAQKEYVANTQGTKEEIIARFEKGVDDNWKQLRLDYNWVAVHDATTATKPSSLLQRPSLAGLREIALKDFKLNTIHRGAYIKGTLCTRAKALVSLQSILRDKDGTITYISFYNMIGKSPTPEAIDRLLPRNTEVIIVEPFFKTRSDATWGIRVDDPRDVIFGADLGLPTSPGEFAVEGSKLFKAKQYAEALVCYEKSLALHAQQSERVLSTLLSNAALCCSKTADEPQALLLAVSASMLEKTTIESGGGKLLCKVYLRIFHALRALGGTTQELALLSRLIKTADAKLWGQTAELKVATALPAMEEKDEVSASMLRFCVAPLLTGLRSLKANTVAGISTEGETETAHRIALKEQGRDKFQTADFASARALYLQAARSGELAQVTATTLRNAGICHSSLGAFDRAALFFTASLSLDGRSIKSC